MVNNIGIEGLKPPEKECKDPKCPWHGKVKVRGQILKGVVVSARAQKTAVVRIDYTHYVPKYERYERRHSRISVHNPSCISAKVGDVVIIGETRPLSKTKHFVILQKVETDESAKG